MAQYLTTSEELTSIADAIRAKTGGNSSLVYPTGFVTDIGKLCKYNWKGENAILVSNLLNRTISLADTNFPNITPSTSTSTILAEQNLTENKIWRAMENEDLIIVSTLAVKFAYKSGYTPIQALDEQYEVYTVSATRRPRKISNLAFNNYFSSLNGKFEEIGIFFDNQGNRSVEWGNNVGVFMYCSLALSNQDSSNGDNVGIIPRSPSLRFAASNTYMTTTACSNIDAENTSIHYTLDMYTCSYSETSGLRDNVMDLYWANHPVNS